MSMTREEAIEIINNMIAVWMNPTSEYLDEVRTVDECVERAKVYKEALSILAPEPRTEPPTKEEVGDDELCLCCDVLGFWQSYEGSEARKYWHCTTDLRMWLPYSALPKGDV